MSSNTKYKRRYRGASDPMTSAKDILERTLNHKRLSKKLEQFSLFTDWGKIVGDDISAVAQPKKMIRGTTLLIEVIDSVWVQELSLQKSTLMRQINDSSNEYIIDDIQFVAGTPKRSQ